MQNFIFCVVIDDCQGPKYTSLYVVNKTYTLARSTKRELTRCDPQTNKNPSVINKNNTRFDQKSSIVLHLFISTRDLIFVFIYLTGIKQRVCHLHGNPCPLVIIFITLSRSATITNSPVEMCESSNQHPKLLKAPTTRILIDSGGFLCDSD